MLERLQQGYKPEISAHTWVEDQDIDSEHTTEVLVRQLMDSIVECKHFLEVDSIPTPPDFEGNK